MANRQDNLPVQKHTCRPWLHVALTFFDFTAQFPGREWFTRNGFAVFEFVNYSGSGDSGKLSSDTFQSHVELFACCLPRVAGEDVSEFNHFGSEDRLLRYWVRLGAEIFDPRPMVRKRPRPWRTQFITGFPRGNEGAAGLLGHALGNIYHFLG